MNKVTRYETVDGKLFKTKAEALDHENLAGRINELRESILPKEFDTCAFSNGSGYIQLTNIQVAWFKNELNNLLKKTHKGVADKGSGYVGRFLCDSNSPLYGLWELTQRIDANNRLWGQPYYVAHSEDAKQKCLKNNCK